FDITASQVDIGNAATEMTQRMTQGVLQPDGKLAVEPRMDVDHVGEQVAFMAELPLESNVAFVTIMATKMPLFGRGGRHHGTPQRDPHPAFRLRRDAGDQ